MHNFTLERNLFAIARTHADAVAGTIPADDGEITMVSKIEQQRRARQRAMSIAEFCERYGVGRTKTYEELKCGRLRGRKIGRAPLSLKMMPKIGCGICLPWKPRDDARSAFRRAGARRRRSRRQVLCPGPGHSAGDRSLSVKPDPADREGFMTH